jgi:hypothetical protein
MSEVLSTTKRSPKPTKRYEEMQRAVQEQRLRVDLHPPARGKNAALKARLLAAEPEVLPPPLPSKVTRTGYYGVVRASASDHGHRNRKPYQARIAVGNASWVHLGSYNTAEEAGRHAAAAHNALLEGSLPEVVETPQAMMIHRHTDGRIDKSTVKWTKHEDDRMIQILCLPDFDVPLNRRGGIAGGSTKAGLGDEAYWRRVAEAMGYGNSVKSARRCSRRWWYLNPKNAGRLQAKRSYERKRKQVQQAQSHVSRQKCLTEALDNVVFEVGENPFESALALCEEASPVEEPQDVIVRLESTLGVTAQPVEEAENVVVHLSDLKEPIDTPDKYVDLYSYEVLSDITAERCSDIGNLDFLNDFNDEGGIYEFYSTGGFFKREVKRTRTPNTEARYVTFTFRCSNLGRTIFKQAEENRMRTPKHIYQKRYRELKKREKFDAFWRATEYDAAWRVARETTKTGLKLPTPGPLPPALEPPPEDATLAPPLVQEHMEKYLKVCKASLKTAMEEVDWAVVKAPPLRATWEDQTPRCASLAASWRAHGVRVGGA